MSSMTSDRRKERKHRVRHEAGDFVPTIKNDLIEIRKSDNDITDVAEKESKVESIYVENNVNAATATQEKSCQSKNERKYTKKCSDFPKGNTSRKEEVRKLDLGTPQKKSETKFGDTNVAYQEQKEYEPVVIMKSKSSTEKDSVPFLPEPAKYRRSEVISNWLKYEDLPPEDDPAEGEDYLMGEDFSQVLNLNVNKNSGGFLHLKGEMSWGKLDQYHLENHGLGALKVAELIEGLATIPFHEQLRISEETLPVFLVSSMKTDAEKNRSGYKPNQKYVLDVEINQKILDDLKLSENEPIRLNPEESITNVIQNENFKISAFESDSTDVNLDTLMTENSMEETQGSIEETSEKVRIKLEVASEEAKKVDESLSPDIKLHQANKSDTDSNSKLDFPTENKPCFDFGLSKANKSKDGDGNTEKKSVKQVTSKTTTEQMPKTNLTDSTANQNKVPVLEKKSEVENLEDWLDSVLDD